MAVLKPKTERQLSLCILLQEKIVRPSTVFRTVSLDPWIYCVSTVPFSLGRSLIERMALSRLTSGAGCETSNPLGKDAERRHASTGWVGERAPLANEKDSVGGAVSAKALRFAQALLGIESARRTKVQATGDGLESARVRGFSEARTRARITSAALPCMPHADLENFDRYLWGGRTRLRVNAQCSLL